MLIALIGPDGCGSFTSFTKEELKKFDQNNILKNIISFQALDSKYINILLNNAYCLLFPSLYEGFGIPTVEALKSGCPVWSSNASSIKELIGSNYPVSYDPTCWEKAYDAFISMDDEFMRKNMIKIGLENSSKFSWEKCADETLAVYEKIY